MDKAPPDFAPPLILLGAMRSGTTLLCRTLETDHVLRVVEEVFDPCGDDREGNFWAFLKKENFSAGPVNHDDRYTQIRSWLEHLQRSSPGRRLVLDVKIDCIRNLDESWLWPGDPPSVVSFFRSVGSPIIYLTRRNLLEQLGSMDLAHQTNNWGMGKDWGKAEAAKTVKMQPGQIVSRLDKLGRRLQAGRQWLDGYSAVLELNYEELLVDGKFSSAVAKKISSLLGQDIHVETDPRTQKLSPPIGALIENYDEIFHVLKKTRYAQFLPGEGRTARNATPEGEPWFSFRIISKEPLITLSSAGLNRVHLSELAKLCPQFFAVKHGIHLIHYTYSVETTTAEVLANALQLAQNCLPRHHIVPLAATDGEFSILARTGFPTLMGNGLIFTDERKWVPQRPTIAGLPIFDSAYVARLDGSKRHELASALESLMLIYGHSLSASIDDSTARIRSVLPRALLANHDLNGGRYKNFSTAELSRLLAHVRVGLCLSKVEGCMRAAMEYLLCGLSVVTTRSIGGRDRYFAGNYCATVDDDPESVAAAVRSLKEQNFDRLKIRTHIAEVLGFDRYLFLQNLNRLISRLLGHEEMIGSIGPFRDAIVFQPLRKVAETLETQSVTD
ncbi:MAG TPA: Stf0 family sulfotransferase [Aestuariivirga sp.]|nr:Stf0 family sulfotransferase [Aestuariivirga sp.]